MPALKAILARIRKLQRKDRDRFLSDISGLIHVGANTGQERYLYAAYGLRVLWIEPIPEIFYKLVANIKAFPGQRAVEDLVTDRDGEEYTFHISNNSGLSSSILALKQHKDIWPDVDYTESIPLTSTTLNSLLQREQIDPAEYQALIMDTQGSELLVLHGAVPVLKNFQYIKTEVADLLVDVSQTGLASGLEFELFQPQGERPQEFYATLPIKIRVIGDYHELGDFVSGVASLPRIVTVHNVRIAKRKSKEAPLTMNLIAKTYRYLEQDERTQEAGKK